MELFENILLGFSTALTWQNLGYALMGVVLGNLIGVLPGIGAIAAIAMLLPVTYGLDPAGALVMLAGIYYGSTYGAAITSILLNLPGTAQHAVVCLDGHPMARQGRAGPALLSAMVASFIGATIGILVLMLFSPLLVALAMQFGPTEYFAVMLLGLFAAATLTRGSALKGLAMTLIGLLAGIIGTDVNTGVLRFTFGLQDLQDGLSLVALAMGLFGVAEVIRNVNKPGFKASVVTTKVTMRSLWEGRKELKGLMGSIWRGSGLGALFGLLPGTGGTLASFLSYATEKKVAKDPKRFGRGAIEGVSGPEAANSSAAQTAFVPTLNLGIPGDSTMALMLGALMIHHIQPGPTLMADHPTVFWGLIASFWIGNVMLMILNIPLIGIWVRMLTVPYRLIFPTVLFFICIGVYSESNAFFDVWVVMAIGLLGFMLIKLGFEPAPMLLGFILGPMVEENFRRALLVSHGDFTVFLTKPISAACILFIACMLILRIYGARRPTSLFRRG
jgi:TctA family transporter